MSKRLLVSSQIQATLMAQILLNEIQFGFWKDQRPATHGLAWDGVEVLVSDTNEVGPVGEWKPVRYYDFLNPEFTKIHEARLVEIARTVKPNVTFKSLKKELIELARIIGGRMTDKTKEPARVYRGNNRKDYDVIRSIDRQKTTIEAAKAAVAASVTSVKKTVTRASMQSAKAKAAAAEVARDATRGVTTTISSSGAKVRHVPVKA